jgi:hypothetical protein
MHLSILEILMVSMNHQITKTELLLILVPHRGLGNLLRLKGR